MYRLRPYATGKEWTEQYIFDRQNLKGDGSERFQSSSLDSFDSINYECRKESRFGNYSSSTSWHQCQWSKFEAKNGHENEYKKTQTIT